MKILELKVKQKNSTDGFDKRLNTAKEKNCKLEARSAENTHTEDLKGEKKEWKIKKRV